MVFTASVERLRDLGFFSLVEAEGTEVVACICLKDCFRDDGAFPGSVKARKPSQNAAWKVQTRGEDNEVSLKGYPCFVRGHPEGLWISTWI